MRNLQEQVKKAFCYQILFWPFTVRINCCSDLKNSRPSAWNFKSFSRLLEQFFLTLGQNNFDNKIPIFTKFCHISNNIFHSRFFKALELYLIDQTEIVRNQNQTTFKIIDSFAQSINGFHIQVISRFVQE